MCLTTCLKLTVSVVTFPQRHSAETENTHGR